MRYTGLASSLCIAAALLACPHTADARDEDFGTFTRPPPAVPVPPAPGARPPQTPTEDEVLGEVFSPEMQAARRAAEAELRALLERRDRPDPVIASLNPDDRRAVMELVELINAFRDEVRLKEQRFAQQWFDESNILPLLNFAFAAEGAQREFRIVARFNVPTIDRSADGSPQGINASVTAGIRFGGSIGIQGDHLRRKQVFTLITDGHTQGRRNCRPHPQNDVRLRNDIICFEHEPLDWILSNYPQTDWYRYPLTGGHALLTMSEEVDGEQVSVEGAILTMTGRVHRALYDPYARMLESLSAAVGQDETVVSGLVAGWRVDLDPHRLVMEAQPDGSGALSLHPAQREAVARLQAYVSRARASWRSYERALSSDLAPLYIQSAARSLAQAQELGRLQEPLYAQLMAAYREVPNDPFNWLETEQLIRVQYASFVNRNADTLDEIDRLNACIQEGFASRNGLGGDLAGSIFHHPLFLVLEMLPELEPGTYSASLPWYVQGETAGLDVAPLASGIGHMPASGGLHLTECGLERDPPEARDDVVVAEAETRPLRAFGAADGSRL